MHYILATQRYTPSCYKSKFPGIFGKTWGQISSGTSPSWPVRKAFLRALWLIHVRGSIEDQSANKGVHPESIAGIGKVRRAYVYHFWNWVLLLTEKAMAPTPVLLPGKSHGWRSLVGCSPGSRRVGHSWRDLAAAAAPPAKVIGVLFKELKAIQMSFNDNIATYVTMFWRLAHYTATGNEWAAATHNQRHQFPKLNSQGELCVWEKPQMKNAYCIIPFM